MATAARTFVSPFGGEGDSVGSPRATENITDLLRTRLRFIVAVGAVTDAGFFLIGLISRWQHFVANPTHVFTDPPFLGVFLVLACLSLAILAFIAPGRQPTLSRLRTVEVSAFAAATGIYAVIAVGSLLSATPAEFSPMWMIYAFAFAAPPGAAVVMYGVFIPNSWRRCATVVIAMAAASTLPDALGLWRDGSFMAGTTAYLILKALLVGVFSTLAIYGAYRIEELRQDVVDARTLGPYMLREQIGSGGMGEVHLAEHQLLRRPCAVKLIRPEFAADSGVLARFEREVQATAKLTHPNTVQIFDYGRAADGTFFYAMEYLPGISLEQLVAEQGALPPARAAHFLSQLCGALQEAHAQGLIHRDIKPSNVIICERGGVADVAKLLDFGLVAAVKPTDGEERLTQVGTIVGTPAFMSPEQCGGAEELTPSSDIYSVGALGYFLLGGKPPFGDRAPMQVMAAHLYEAPKPLSTHGAFVPPELEAVIMRCLAKAPEGRFRDVAALAAALATSVASG